MLTSSALLSLWFRAQVSQMVPQEVDEGLLALIRGRIADDLDPNLTEHVSGAGAPRGTRRSRAVAPGYGATRTYP